MFAVLSAARKMPSRLILLAPVIWLAACQAAGVGTAMGPSVNTARPVPVALLVPHGAASPQEQQLAQDLENAARLAVADLQGVKLDLRVYGTAGQAEQAREAAAQAVADGARVIVGPLHAQSANAAAVAAARRGVNVLAFSNNPTVAGGNLFILGQTYRNSAERLMDYAVRQGRSRVVAVHSDNLSGRLGRQAIETAASRSGASVVGSVSYEFSQDGVIEAVPAIREAAETGAADMIFLAANTAGALPLFSQMLPEAGLSRDKVQYIGLTRWDTPPQTLELPGVQGGWFALPDPQRSAAFNRRFEAAHDSVPHPIATLAYDGIAAVGALVGSGRSDALTRPSLTQAAGFQGVNGVFRLRPDGTNERGLAVATIRDKKVGVIDPAPRSFGRAGLF